MTLLAFPIPPPGSVRIADDLLHTLLFQGSSRTSSRSRLVWDLSGLVKAVLSLIPDPVNHAVRTHLFSPSHRAVYNAYRLYYIPDKMFGITCSGSDVVYYDLSQYFPGEDEPRDIASLQSKADRLSSALRDLGVGEDVSLASPFAAFRDSSLIRGLVRNIPAVYDAGESELEAYDIASRCTPNEWVSNYQVGNFPKLYSYDLASAYPSVASRLIDLRDCYLRRLTSMDYSAYYGFLVGSFTVYPDSPLAFCSPFLVDRGDGVLVNFTGTRDNHACLLDEVRLLENSGLGEFHLDHGWFFYPRNGVRPRFPFRDFMLSLYAQRGADDLRSYVLKRVMNGLVGKLLESRRDGNGNVLEYGDLYNSIYHSICTTETRLAVFRFVAERNLTRDSLVHVGVDGVKSTQCVDLPEQSGLGEWRRSGCDSVIVLSPGAILSSDRNYKGTSYSEMVVQCLSRPGASKYGVDAGDPIDLRKLWVNQNRLFSHLPRTGGGLLDGTFLSDPIRV